MRIKDLDNFQDQLKEVELEAERIRNTLNLHLPMTQDQLNGAIKSMLKRWNFNIYSTSILRNFEDYGHLPSMTIFNHPTDRSLGGHIYIYGQYPPKKRRELLLHEFVHIMDTLTPDYSTNRNDIHNGYMLSKDNLKNVELKTELTAMALMMPAEQFVKELFDNSYNVKKIVNDYSQIETNLILKWIALHDLFSCHYADIFLVENENGSRFIYKIDEYCKFDSNFDIMNIIVNPNSIAYKSRKDRTSYDGESNIDNRSYYCFSFYEEGIQQPLPSEKSTVEQLLNCDELMVLGWPKNTYDIMKKLKFEC
jgi:hypothetical protein